MSNSSSMRFGEFESAFSWLWPNDSCSFHQCMDFLLRWRWGGRYDLRMQNTEALRCFFLLITPMYDFHRKSTVKIKSLHRTFNLTRHLETEITSSFFSLAHCTILDGLNEMSQWQLPINNCWLPALGTDCMRTVLVEREVSFAYISRLLVILYCRLVWLIIDVQ